MTLNNYEIVYLKSDIKELNLSAGIIGTVVMIHSESPPVYEVEFMDESGDSLGYFTVDGECIRRFSEK